MEKSKTPSELYLTKLLEKNDFIVLVAFYEKDLIGGLTAYELPLCSAEKSEIFIYDIAIKNEFQRKGVGKKLLSFLKDYCKQNDISIFFVEAHEEDVHAVDFYHSTGGNAEKVVHFNYEIEE